MLALQKKQKILNKNNKSKGATLFYKLCSLYRNLYIINNNNNETKNEKEKERKEKLRNAYKITCS